MGYKILCFGIFCVLFAYYIYTPIPENIEERWKVRMIDAVVKTTSLVATLFEETGLMKYEDTFLTLSVHLSKPVSDENVTVIDTDFSDVPVRLYLPEKKSEILRPAIIYLHGGAFVLGSCKMQSYDDLNRWTANKLDAVVVGIDYRLAPQYPFPAALEDCVLVVKFLLQDKILEKYGIDPARICISGDSAGATLAAAATQLLQNHPEYKDKIKAQALIYPGLQFIDIAMPSHQDNEQGPIMSMEMGVKFLTLYLNGNSSLKKAMLRNEHMPEGSRHLFKFVNWSDFLPDKYKKNHIYTEPVLGKLKASYPALLDSRLSPLLASDSQLQSLPLTYILTCEHDIVRDDGFIYVARLRNVGVQVTHDHIEDGVHGAITLTTLPYNLQLALRIRDKYINWLEKNL